MQDSIPGKAERADLMARQADGPRRDGEIDMLGVAVFLWAKAGWIAAGTLVAACVGLLVAFTAAPVYHAECILSPKDSKAGGMGSSLFSQFGGLGSMAAAQFGMGNTNLERMELILKSRDMAEKVINGENLLPELFRNRWDAEKGDWKEPPGPTLENGTDLMEKSLLTVLSDPKKNALTVGVDADSPALAAKIAKAYVAALQQTLWENAKTSADSNRKYLEEQLSGTADPLLREKIQQLIGAEIEKTMLVKSSSFDVLETPAIPSRPSKPKKKVILLLSLALGMVFSILGVLAARRIGEMRSALAAAPRG